jgi:hypothetical protein
MAAPHVAGAAALLLSGLPRLAGMPGHLRAALKPASFQLADKPIVIEGAHAEVASVTAAQLRELAVMPELATIRLSPMRSKWLPSRCGEVAIPLPPKQRRGPMDGVRGAILPS